MTIDITTTYPVTETRYRPLYLVRLPVNIPALYKWAADRSLIPGDGSEFDDGRALHHLLTESFGQGCLQPFRLMVATGGKQGSLYAYCQHDPAALRAEAEVVAPPEHLDVIDLDGLSGKPMPAVWQAGRRLGFELRVRPVRRLLKPVGHTGQKSFHKGDELDAFLLACLRNSPDGEPGQPAGKIEREQVYRDWLAERLAGAANVTGVRMTSFQRHIAWRKGQGGKMARLEGPDAILQGDLEITDPDAFRLTLQKGVGRHRAYGFGMLLLRPLQAGGG